MHRLPLLIVGLFILPGCINRWNTRLPSPNYGSIDQQKRGAQLQDPYPEAFSGPEMGFRPPGFETQRSDAYRAKQSYEATILRQQLQPQFGPPTGVQPSYPGTVAPR
ncbi:MAG: hypothetical protein R3B90_12255 [Planctomycetaceae bacterium]